MRNKGLLLWRLSIPQSPFRIRHSHLRLHHHNPLRGALDLCVGSDLGAGFGDGVTELGAVAYVRAAACNPSSLRTP